MRLGFLTACLPDRPLDRIASWAAENGFEALEVAAWPRLGNRPFTASHVKARYRSPVSQKPRPSARAARDPTVLFPDEAGPSIATTGPRAAPSAG